MELKKAVLVFIHCYHDRNQWAPSYREIGDALGMVVANVHYTLGVLENRGYIARLPNSARAIRVTEAGRRFAGI